MAAMPSPAGDRQRFSWDDYFAFRVMVTPVLIRLVYLIGVVLITVAAIFIPLYATPATVCTTTDAGTVCSPVQGSLISGLLVGIIVFIVGQLYFRVVMELLMVIFGIHESVRAIEARDRG